MDEVQSIVKVCTQYWQRTRVPRHAIAEMRGELESHLRDAAAEGKPVSSVVGEDVTAFAEQWAGEYRQPFVRPSSWDRAGPALLALLVGGWMFWMSSSIATSMEYVSGECCPWTVVERSTEPTIGGEFFYWVSLAAAALSIIGAFLLLFRQLVWGSVALALGAIAALVMPPGWVVSLMLLVALVWAQWVVRRAYRQKVPALTT